MVNRVGSIVRTTKETNIRMALSLDGSGKAEIDTGIGFLNHMLNAFVVHGCFDLIVKCEGDLDIDGHHTVEDTGIVLGMALEKALGGNEGICRYGNATIPMDESLATCCVDICGRDCLVFKGTFAGANIGTMETQMVREFFKAVASNARITLHLNILYGENDHHKCEAVFKAFAYALKKAVEIRGAGDEGALSSKGVL
jgi:imidazoleglycerol-phosphate dehydratase